MHVAVVGDRQAVHAEPLDVIDELGDPVRAVEERVFAVGLEMDETHGEIHRERPAGHPYAPSPGRAPGAEPIRGRSRLRVARVQEAPDGRPSCQY